MQNYVFQAFSKISAKLENITNTSNQRPISDQHLSLSSSVTIDSKTFIAPSENSNIRGLSLLLTYFWRARNILLKSECKLGNFLIVVSLVTVSGMTLSVAVINHRWRKPVSLLQTFIREQKSGGCMEPTIVTQVCSTLSVFTFLNEVSTSFRSKVC